MTPSEYFSDYNNVEDEVEYGTEKEIDADIQKRLWIVHKYIFEFILKACPFNLSHDQYEWIVSSLDDI